MQLELPLHCNTKSILFFIFFNSVKIIHVFSKMPSVKLRVLCFPSFKLTSGVFALLGTDDTDRTRVDCSDPPGAPGDLLYLHSIGNPRFKITDTAEKGVGGGENSPCSHESGLFSVSQTKTLKRCVWRSLRCPHNAKNRPVHCWGGRIGSAAGAPQEGWYGVWLGGGVSGANWWFSLFCEAMLIWRRWTTVNVMSQ